MDWATIMQNQEELKKSFSMLRAIFEQAEKEFLNKDQIIRQSIVQSQQVDGANLMKIHQALSAIISSNDSVKPKQVN